MCMLQTSALSLALAGLAALAALEPPGGPSDQQAPASGEANATETKQLRVVEVRDVRIDPASPDLSQIVPEVVFEEQPFEQVIEWLAEFSRLNVIVRWRRLEDDGIRRGKPISVKCRNLRLSQVLWVVLNEAGGGEVEIGFEPWEGIVLISTAEDLELPQVVRIYDARPLLLFAQGWDSLCRQRTRPELGKTQATAKSLQAPHAITSRPLPHAESPGAPHAVGQLAARDAEKHAASGRPEESLVQLVQEVVRPDVWTANGGIGAAHCFGGLLVVRASRTTHRQVHAFLSALLESVVEESQQE